VFHSTVEDMLPHQGELPFAVIADPGREIYTAFGVGSALRAGRNPGPAKGESPLGLPADFLMDSKRAGGGRQVRPARRRPVVGRRTARAGRGVTADATAAQPRVPVRRRPARGRQPSRVDGQVHKAEGLGYDTIAVIDHLGMPALFSCCDAGHRGNRAGQARHLECSRPQPISGLRQRHRARHRERAFRHYDEF
jgi:hypothetical protein